MTTVAAAATVEKRTVFLSPFMARRSLKTLRQLSRVRCSRLYKPKIGKNELARIWTSGITMASMKYTTKTPKIDHRTSPATPSAWAGSPCR